jgi:uncharacterized protein YjbI with pentapeptide repeats
MEVPMADLSGKSLENLDLSNSDFKGVNLSGANFFGAKLDGADFSGAIGCRRSQYLADLLGAEIGTQSR